MKFEELKFLTQQEIYELVTKERITASSPHEKNNRSFPIGSRAYRWTNEALNTLEDELHLDLENRNMLIVSASGDPFATFAYLNAGNQVGFDTSHRAVLWAELKLKAIDTLNYNGFKRFMALDEEHGREKLYWGWLSKKISPYAQSFFKPMFDEHITLRHVIENGNLFRNGGCTGYFPQSNIYCFNEEFYEKARVNLRSHQQILIPSSLDDAVRIANEKFGGFYGSNILDHFKHWNGCESHEEIISIVGPFLKKVDSCLDNEGLMILQFEWCPQLREAATAFLADLGYDINMAKNSENKGYGQLCVARKK